MLLVTETETIDLSVLAACFGNLTDPRIDRRKLHALSDIVIIGLASIISGGNGFTDMETFGNAKRAQLAQFLSLKNGIPSHDTFGNVFAALAPAEMGEALQTWVTRALSQTAHDDTTTAEPAENLIALDGKRLRGSHDASTQQAQIQCVGAWAHAHGLLLAQVKVAAGTNEITTIPQVLQLIDIAGSTVTADALNCQKEIVAQIRQQKGDYVLALKKNHQTLQQAVAEYLTNVRTDKTHGYEWAQHETIDKGHGRLEIRRYWQAAAPDWLPEFSEWRDLRSVGCVAATRTTGEKTTVETRYYLSSQPVDVERFARCVRGHWSIENSCHWVLDVTFGEDASRARVKNAAENLATLRRFALNQLKRTQTEQPQSIRTKRLRAGWDADFWLTVLRN